jgi:excisionase family DNA binding protein
MQPPVDSYPDALRHHTGGSSLDNSETFVTAVKAGQVLELHPATVQRLARQGDLPAHPVSIGKRKHWRFLLSELHKWLRSRTGKTGISA